MALAIRYSMEPFPQSRSLIPAVKRKRKFADLEKSLGYKFKDQDLLARALTHASTRTGAVPPCPCREAIAPRTSRT